MGWSEEFKAKIGAQTVAPVFILQVLKWAGTPGRDFAICSHEGYGLEVAIGENVRLSGSGLVPVTWRYTHGTANIEIVGATIAQLAYHAPRGAICVLKMGFAGWSEGLFEPIFMGRVSNITGTGPSWNLELWDGTSILMSRLALGISSYTTNANNIFHNIGPTFKTTIATSNYAAGDSTLDVADSSDFEKLDGAGTTGAVLVDNGTDPAFYLTYTGISGNQLTGVSTSDRLGTTQANSAIGSNVYNAAYLEGAPRVLFLRLLLSGSGTSTLYDKYPDSWGFKIPADLVDIGDIVDVSQALEGALSSGSYTLQYAQSSEVTDSWSWLLGFFTDLGIVPIQRQGRLTFRPVQNPDDPVFGSSEVASITDDDIVAVLNWSAYHREVGSQYSRIQVTADGISSRTSFQTVRTLPAADTLTYDNSDKIFQNQTAIADEIKARVAPWGVNIPEHVSIECAGLRLAGLVPTDIVQLSTSGIHGGRISPTRLGYDAQPCMVLRVSPDYMRGSVRLELAPIQPL